MDLNKTNKLIEHSLFLFVPKQDKINIINDDNTDLNTKIKLIKSLSSKIKNSVFENIYKYENTNLSQEELIEIFKLLSLKDKLIVYEYLNKEDSKKYLEYFNKREVMLILINQTLKTQDRIYIIDNLITQKQREEIYKHLDLYLRSEEMIAIIKHYDDETRREIILKKRGQINKLTKNEYIRTLSYLPTVEEKLVYLNDFNKYKIKLDLEQKIKLIITTNDEQKIKFIKENNIANFQVIEILKSLTDEGKLNLINNKEEMNQYLTYYIEEFYRSFSEKLARELIKNKGKYHIDLYRIEHIINCLPAEERLEYLYGKNRYDINLSSYQQINILVKLPEEQKIKLLKKDNLHNISLQKEDLVSIAKTAKIKNLIEILIKSPEKYYDFQIEDIWKIIESKSQKEVLYLLNKEDKDIKLFIEKYKTSIVKCLDEQDRIDIIYNRSKHGLHLEDNRKIKILKTIKLYSNQEVLDENIFYYFDNSQKVIDKLITEKHEFNSLNIKIQEQLVEFLIGTKDNPELTNICLNIIKYTDNAKEILEKLDKFQLIFNKLNINLLDFIQYGINSNKYEWNKILLNIINNNKFEEFTKVKNYFFNNYYKEDEHKKNTIENFLELLNAYNEYEILCKNLTNKNRKLTEQELLDIKYIFQRTLKTKPQVFEDIENLRNDEIKLYKEIAINNYNLYSIKDSIIKLFFGKSIYDLEDILKNNGGTQELNILKFNNRDNQEYVKVIEHVLLMTEFLERVILTNDLLGLKQTLQKYTSEENLEETKKYINYFSKYEEFVRKIYELDVQNSLTNINNIDDNFTKTVKAKELSNKYGGKVIDLSASQYVLLGHVKSRNESIDNLLSGTCDGNSNFICTSPVSHRGQHYYSYTKFSTVFAYDSIPKDSFICSSIDNLGSNGVLKHNTSETPEFRRTQKGILETSEAASHRNAEMLLYREETKPCGIIIPTGTIPSDEAIEYHKKYNLPFIITQGIDETIENPKTILSSKSKIKIDDSLKNLDKLEQINIESDKLHERKIAILTDPHALYEPTMACLNDIKSKGITEIYSLGDNIGHGPSPKETLELLKQYNVKSIIGNHELYVIEDDSMETFKEHLINTGALERTIDMTNWIKQEITEEQLEEIKQYKDKYEIIAPNKEKITLIHSTKPYNEQGKYSNEIALPDSDLIIEGHKHFASQSKNNYIIRAVGIGQTKTDDGLATYAILTINSSYNYLEIKNVPYNRSNLLHTINESNMPVSAKALIKSWVGINKK